MGRAAPLVLIHCTKMCRHGPARPAHAADGAAETRDKNGLRRGATCAGVSGTVEALSHTVLTELHGGLQVAAICGVVIHNTRDVLITFKSGRSAAFTLHSADDSQLCVLALRCIQVTIAGDQESFRIVWANRDVALGTHDHIGTSKPPGC